MGIALVTQPAVNALLLLKFFNNKSTQSGVLNQFKLTLYALLCIT